ncbi:MAG: glycerol-3-phosphate acyltransferase, partial [Chloroflexi bacterium]|nr:glycerol-3-phosphate acyltransferase [Chloroflexota bacterium]
MGVVAIILAYIIGALPMGYLAVKYMTGKDITGHGSGRTGGTNAMRAGGFWAGLATALLDVSKGFASVWIARWLMPESIWWQIICGAVAVFGHNWSVWVYLLRGRFSAGAGTGPNVGVATAFWAPSALVLFPIVALFILVVGYASVASLVAALLIPILFLLRFIFVGTPWEYVIYGLITS